MNSLYLDIFSGISGDMFIGAMIDLGVAPEELEHELARLGLHEYHLHTSREMRGAIAGVKFDVHTADHHGHVHDHGDHHHHHHPDEAHSHSHDEHEHPHSHAPHRSYADIKKLILSSSLSPWVKEQALAVFDRVAQAEAKIHGQSVDQVHFHEVGAIDSIVDIIGACIALEKLGKPRVFAGSVIEGTGVIRCAHGVFPLPAPATLEILSPRGVAVQQCEEPHELITPTGAALLAQFVESFGPMRGFTPAKIGYGLGSRQNHTRPNVLRAILGQTASEGSPQWESDTIAVLESNLDDTNPEILGAFVEKALGAGALDVFYTPIQMKKSRPGVMLTVLCPETDADRFSLLMLRETSAFGVRRSITERRKLQREFKKVTTPFGAVNVKIGRLGAEIVQVAPEYEDCKAVAENAQIPLKRVYEAAVRAAGL